MKRFSPQDDKFIVENFLSMSDAEMARQLGRNQSSILERRKRLGLYREAMENPIEVKKDRVERMPENDKRLFYEKECKESVQFMMVEPFLSTEEKSFYCQMYGNFMLDESIVSMTEMERDRLFDMLMNRIEIMRYMKQQEDGKTDRSKEISSCYDNIAKIQESLSVERKQRLKNGGDQAMNFTTIIKELKDPEIRRKAGIEAAQLKFIGEMEYNDLLGKNIISGRDGYDLSKNFKGRILPSGYLMPKPSGTSSRFVD